MISDSLYWFFWWITRRTKHTSHVTCFSKVLWFEENAEQATCHLSLHLLSNPLRHRRCARCLPILCVCVSVHVRDVSWVLWRYVLSLLSGCGRVSLWVSLRVLNICSPLPRHLYAFDRCPWCWTTVWVKAGVIEWGTCTHTGGRKWGTYQVWMVKWCRPNLITLLIESTSSLAPSPAALQPRMTNIVDMGCVLMSSPSKVS